jgi:uncharacterized membrane protein YphA (DoxX/SURF4 family)
MNKTIEPFIVYILKLILGITFIWASYSKIQDPAGFARIIYGYDIFPSISINLIAVVLPFIELVAGFSLIMRLFPKSAVLIINVLLGVFILLIGFNLLRGHAFDCGCFSVAGQTGPVSAGILLVRDAVLLAGGIWVWKKSP